MAILCCHNYRPIFSPQQCQMIVDAGHQQKPEVAKVGGGEKGAHDTRSE